MSRIVAEAQREQIPLSETEEKMLYFSETGWTLPEISEVNAAFDREYNMSEYEDKIAALIRKFRKHARKRSSAELEAWDEAVRFLRNEDHYVLVMVDRAASPADSKATEGGIGDENRLAKLVLIGFAGFLICAALLIGYMWLKH